jgi:ABC-type Fe3+ transport system substrate-binding protein
VKKQQPNTNMPGGPRFLGRHRFLPLLPFAIFASFAVPVVLGLLGGCSGKPAASTTDKLVIYSPHSDEIEQEFQAAFIPWYRAETGREVELSWPDVGGTTQIIRRIQDKFVAGRYDVDLVFGGGPIFDRMKQLGFLQPCPLPREVLAALPNSVAGQPLYDPDFTWYGAAISTFGLIYNKKMIADRGLPQPESWDVMADPKYFGLVGAADATKSGSIRKAYEIILQAYGYERGMSILVRMGANAREFSEGASDVPRLCAQGFVAVGACIDFYAQRQMLAEGGENVGFVSPKGLTVINCDPIGVLKNAPDRAVAEKFVEFVMSPAGQRLWMTPAGTPGGPQKHALERLSVLPGLYAPGAGTRFAMNPFEMPPADFYDAAKETARLTILPDYLRAALVDNYKPLREAWQAIVGAGLPADLVAELVQPLITEDEMQRLGRDLWTPIQAPEGASAEVRAELARKEESRLREQSDRLTEWTRTLRERYERLAQTAARRSATR